MGRVRKARSRTERVSEPRSGRPKTVDDAVIIAATLEPPPERLGATHWSTRLLARQLGLGDATVARAWRRYHVQPWRRETFKFSTDPNLVAKVREVVGLYLDPPAKAGDSFTGRPHPDARVLIGGLSSIMLKREWLRKLTPTSRRARRRVSWR